MIFRKRKVRQNMNWDVRRLCDEQEHVFGRFTGEIMLAWSWHEKEGITVDYRFYRSNSSSNSSHRSKPPCSSRSRDLGEFQFGANSKMPLFTGHKCRTDAGSSTAVILLWWRLLVAESVILDLWSFKRTSTTKKNKLIVPMMIVYY